MAIGPEGEILLGECKWGTTDAADLRRLRARADLITRELKGVRRVHLALFSGRGLSDDVLAEVDGGQVLHFDRNALYGV